VALHPDNEIERLKREVPLERLVTGFGIELKRHGANLLGRCPFHEGREPSLVVTPEKNVWHCLGACQAGGSTIDWVMKTRGVSFRHAVELLRADHPSLVSRRRRPRGARLDGEAGIAGRAGRRRSGNAARGQRHR
jgi:DNA primase